jgi:hypothetical protein
MPQEHELQLVIGGHHEVCCTIRMNFLSLLAGLLVFLGSGGIIAAPDPVVVSMSVEGKLSIDGKEVTALESPSAFVKRMGEIDGGTMVKWIDPKRDFFMFPRLGITVYHDRGNDDAEVINVLLSLREGKDLPLETFVGSLAVEGINVPKNATGQYSAQEVRKALKTLNPEANDKIEGPNAAIVIGHLPWYDFLYFSPEPDGRIKEISLGVVLSKGRMAWMRVNGEQVRREALKRQAERNKQ